LIDNIDDDVEEDKKHITLFGMYGAYAPYHSATSSS
jgi:hypothetical protein